MESDILLEYFTESKNLSFLYDPKSYYNQLCSMFKNAKQKIVISCLYIGTLPLEQEFVSCIFSAKRNNPDLVIELLLDKQRSMRRENTGKCILDLVKPLLKEKNVSLRLFHSPLCDAFCNTLLRPPYSEVLGTLHMKIYVADNVSVISGANCSTPYFTNRMDRYMVVDDPLFANLMYTIVKTVGTAAYRTTEDLDFVWDSDLINPLDDNLLFKRQIYKRFVTMIRMCNDALEPILTAKVFANFSLEEKRSKTSRLLSRLVQRRKSLSITNGVLTTRQNSLHTPDLVKNDSFESFSHLDDFYSEPSQEGLKESLSGQYAATPTSYLTRSVFNGFSTGRFTHSSFSSARTGVVSSRSVNGVGVRSGRNNGEHEYCAMCTNYSGTVIDDFNHTPYRIRRRYPPMEGFTRFMFFFQLGFSDPPFKQDEELCKDLMIKYRKSGHSVILATSYLNFTDNYSDMCTYLLNCKSPADSGSFYVLTSSPAANDFNNCSDSKKLIPALYCHYQNLLLEHVNSNSPRKDESDTEDRCFYFEYHNPGYTFHHKGIWMFHGDVPPDTKNLSFEQFKRSISGPCAMLIGSSNLSRRSHHKDLEMTVLVETNSVNVLDPIKFELYTLFSNAKSVSLGTVAKRPTLLHRMLAFLLRQYF